MITVIYTSIFSGYDVLKQPAPQDIDCIFICFTNSVMPPRVGAWYIVHAEADPAVHPRIAAKRFKILSHKIFCDGVLDPTHGTGISDKQIDLSIWVDGSIAIKSRTFASDMHNRLGEGAWAMFVHPDRDCIYEEAIVISTLPKFAHLPVFDQVETYRATVPPHSGLFASGIIVRREPSSDRLARLHQLWWDEILKWTFRDQLSLPFILTADEGCQPVKICEELRTNAWFDIVPHSGTG